MKQLHLSLKLDCLNENEQKQFLDLLSPDLLASQQKKLKASSVDEEFELVSQAESASEDWRPLGIERLTQGKVACLILAGGQGSRLGLSIPKALVPVTQDGKTLLEIHLEKISLASEFHRTRVPCAILTSIENHETIAEFLKDKKYNLSITLVIQDQAPFLDEQGNWILREDGKLAAGPDGNGYALHLLKKRVF